MFAAFQPHHLRLVGRGDDDVSAARGELAIVQENRLAAHAGSIDAKQVDARDPRWVLAMQTQARLQGTMLTPERRDELLLSGKRLGLRAFESSLVIAVVQDRARNEQPLHISEPVVGITSVAAAQPLAVSRYRTWLWWLAAITCAMLLAAIAIRWLSTT